MADKASPAGWVVQVTPPDGGEPPVFAFYNVAIASVGKAVEVVRKLSGATTADRVYAVRSLSTLEVAAIKQKRGEVKPA